MHLDPFLNAKAWYLWCFASYVAVGPFLNVFLEHRGLSKAQMGLVGALRPWLNAPASFLWAALADRLHAHRAVLLVTFAGAVGVRMLLLLPRSFGGMLAVALAAEVLAAPASVLADAAVMRICHKESDYGKFRLWGAVGWGGFSTPAGWLISHLGIRWAFYTQAILAAPSLFHGAHLFRPLPETGSETHHHHHHRTAAGGGGCAAAADRQRQRRAGAGGARPPGLGSAADEAGRGHDGHGYESSSGSECDDGDRDLEAEPLLPVHAVAQEQTERLSHRSTSAAAAAAVAVGAHPEDAGGAARGSRAAPAAAAGGEGRAAGAGAVGEEEEQGPGGGSFWRRLWGLLRRWDVLLFFLVALVMGYGFGTIDSFLFLYLEEMGASGTLMGLTLTITCAAEVPAFQLQDRLLDRWGVAAVLDLVMAVYALRLALYAALPAAGNVMWVLPIELLHGVTFACGWGAGTVNCKLLAPPELAATLQGAFQGLYFGAGYGLGSLVGGWVGTKLGWQGMFACASATMLTLCVATMAARWILTALWKPPADSRGKSVELSLAANA